MAILKIARMGHPVLRKPARPVADPTAPEVRRLVEDMFDTMVNAEGTGLAAPQVHVPLAVVLFYVAQDRHGEEGEPAPDDLSEGEHAFAVPPTVLINPRWEALGEEMETGVEGCLSVPGLIGEVPRFRKIRYGGLTPEGREIAREAEGFHARVVQHECDHLEGILYPQRMSDLSSLVFTSEVGARFSEEEALRRY
jgi:peptide deformylase